MAGAGYKLFATGDVLTAAQVNTYLMEQTVMRFADSAARTTALSGVLAEGMVSYLQDTNTLEVYDGAAWVGATGDITGLTAGTGISISSATGPVPTVTNSMATEITAKGDLIVGTGSATFDNLAAGSNGETLVADSSTSTGLRYQANFAAGKNKIINGDFGIWQRGTSFTVTTATFAADRFFHNRDGNGTVTASQQTFTAGSAPVAGYESQYFLQLATTSVGTSTYHQTQQYIEDVRTFAGQTITVSFWARLSTGTVGSSYFRVNQNFGSGGSAQVAGSTNNFTMTGSWQRFSATVTLASISGKTIGTGSNIAFDLVVPFTATNTIQIWGVQVEAGNTATAFQTATGTLQGELAACQRYYYRATSAAIYGQYGGNPAYDANTASPAIAFPVSMRVAPTSLETSGTSSFIMQNNSAISASSFGSIALNTSVTTQTLGVADFNKSAGYTSGTFYKLIANGLSTTYLGFSAEL